MNGILSRLKKPSCQAASKGCAPCLPGKPCESLSWGFYVFLAVILGASVLSSVRFSSPVKVFLAGEVASQDVTAEQTLRYEDREATKRKREQVSNNQPPVFDLSLDPFELLSKNVLGILALVKRNEEDQEKLRASISEDLNVEISRDTFSTWRSQEFQDVVTLQVLPWLREAYARGVAANPIMFAPYKQGVLLRELPSGMETLHLEGPAVLDMERLKEELDQLLRRDLKKNIRVRKAVFALTGPYLVPSIVYNQGLTQERKREIVESMEPVYASIHRGEMIVRQGERVTADQQSKLQALYAHRGSFLKPLAIPGTFLLSCLFFVLLHLSHGKKSGIRAVSNRDWLTLAAVTAFFVLLAKFVELARISEAHLPVFLKTGQVAFGLPVAGAAGVLAMFLPQALCSFAVLLLSYLVTNEVGGNLYLFSYYMLGGLVYASIIRDCETRQDVLRSILPLAALCVVSWLGIALVQDNAGELTLAGGVHAAFNAVFSLLLVLGLSPILELVFGYTSRFRLMELMNLEQPLLQELMVSAPGTYHHSVIVANMAEAAARAVGANALLAKVAALYHDIGKLKNPQYFIENLYGKENKHNKLSPSMSALILISHVKKGVELAREHKLGDEIASLIGQHHGMTLIAYFYHKAQEQAEAKGEEPVREEEFRYPGPKPQSKEAGIIMLADAIEASSRTLVDPTPSRIRGHIQSIMRKLYNEGELDGSELTLKDLTQASETFHKILTGIFHHRIEYPNLDKSKNKDKENGDKNAAPEKAA
ncbi:Cyclic-di-AMP phosphodiesterase PgpH [Fundidesulfovibrio magnetotacticus]|uniref:Cyclic-di-AMP phosphodiesterase PgpH n=1 Tax=Fundidesulfovibrio magnetotacticus TaxID=2730080 RepID=A0A6V8LZ91_9BACT|nr:HDIG domain-containing metalloprotein [Fundidesulfovibrio magnetotacticus]GFK95106.1 Cyclic-di-AMP phosphodiesterase PgpH [Fundidesulfovibrio magnetotacticus]